MDISGEPAEIHASSRVSQGAATMRGMLTAADRKLFAHAAARHSVFSIAEAGTAGLTEPQIRLRAAHLWERVYDGVFRVPGATATWRSELRGAVLAAGTGSAISHRSAAALYELPGGRDNLIELTTPRWNRTIRRGLVVHESRRLEAEDLRQVDGITVTKPELLLLHLAAQRPFADYLELVIHAARRRRLVTYESTRETFDRHARRALKGTRALRAALDRWDPTSVPTESDMETRLLHALRTHGLPEPVVQFEVRDRSGRLIARVDAAYPDARIAIEYDSKQEHSDEFQLARDARRRNALAAAGYVTISVRYGELDRAGADFCRQIKQILRKRRQPA